MNTTPLAPHIDALCQDVDEAESQLTPLQAERERVRAELSVLVEQNGGKTMVEGLGRLELSRTSVHVSYDCKLLEMVILKLIDMGQYHVADAIHSCKKESMRPGVLRIMRALPELKQ